MELSQPTVQSCSVQDEMRSDQIQCDVNAALWVTWLCGAACRSSVEMHCVCKRRPHPHWSRQEHCPTLSDVGRRWPTLDVDQKSLQWALPRPSWGVVCYPYAGTCYDQPLRRLWSSIFTHKTYGMTKGNATDRNRTWSGFEIRGYPRSKPSTT